MRAGLLALVLVAGCSVSDDTVRTQQEARVVLEIEVRADEGAEPERYVLTCDPTIGGHPEPEAACGNLTAEALQPLPADAVCAEVYGGPQTATVRGRFEGQRVDLALSRTDACRTAQWDRLGALLPPPS